MTDDLDTEYEIYGVDIEVKDVKPEPFVPIPDFKPGLLSDLMEKQPFHKEQK